MKNKKILYTGTTTEITWAAIAYVGPSFLITLAFKEKTPFMVANAFRAAFMFVLCLIFTIPMILLKHNIINLPEQLSFIYFIYKNISLICSTILLFEYITSVIDTINGKYKTKFFMSKISENFISKYIYEEFMQQK